MFQQEIEDKGLTVAVSLRAKRFHVWADPGRFQQVLLNLLSNAVKFTPEDGTVTVRTSNENGTVKIEVIDTGVGIEPDVLPRLFRPFEQGERTVDAEVRRAGAGPVDRQVAGRDAQGEHHRRQRGHGQGGHVHAARRDRRADPTAARRSASCPGCRDARACRVLLVEDHEDTRHVLSELSDQLRLRGHDGREREGGGRGSGPAGVRPAAVRHRPAGRERHGRDAAHGARQSKSAGIALSGFGQDEDLRRSREAGFAHPPDQAGELPDAAGNHQTSCTLIGRDQVMPGRLSGGR